MDYEAFTARANGVLDDCSEMKSMLWNMQTVVGAVPDMVRKNELLEKEKAELKAEIERLKSEVPGDCMSLPLDADGVPIEVGEVVYYCDKESGEPKAGFGPFRVIDYDPHAQAVLLRYEKGGVDGYGNYSESFESCELLTHRKPDSWEKLEEDAKMVKACDYAHAPRDEYGITVCRDCRFQKSKSCRQEMILDMIARAKKLAGIEEQEGGKRTAIAGNEEER